MMANKKTLLLFISTLTAGAIAALLALALVSGPAVSQEMKASQAKAATPSEACAKATWPYIPAQCLTRSGVDDGAPAKPVSYVVQLH